MELINIHGDNSFIYLFKRDSQGKQVIDIDKTFKPFFYEPDPNGIFKAYNGTKLSKVVLDNPNKVRLKRTPNSYSSDVPYVKNYIIHKIDRFTKCPIKYFFIDIEILSSGGVPNPQLAKDPISCITVYNSFTKSYKTWWIKDYGYTYTGTVGMAGGVSVDEAEYALLEDFYKYMYIESPDLWLSWNVDFDYNYLYNRFNKTHSTQNFAKSISPIGQMRAGKYSVVKEDSVNYPAGISILDYLQLFKKVFMREASYKLDYIAQKHLKEEPWAETDFTSLDDIVRDKNINDVARMVKLEDKFKLIDYFDEIRILCTCLWEDLYYNSFLIEMILFRLAKNKGVVLPNAKKGDEDETFEGATREVKRTGALFDIGKFDLSSAYPNMIVNFCLDPVNITEDMFHPDAINVQGLNIIQDETALCPAMVKELLTLKDKRKKELESTSANTPERKEAKRKYDAIKGVVNSAFGVFGLSNFRLYDNRIASRIAGLARECLTYCKDETDKLGYEVVYWDTDSVFVNAKEDISDVLNDFIKEWGEEKYGKLDVSVEFTYEGYFKRLFIVARCRYIGDLVDAKTGEVEEEIKGVEMKRSSSTEYEKRFQKELFDLVLDGKSFDDVVHWVSIQKENIKNAPIKDIAFPCKITNREYKNRPIFIRAHDNTKELGKFSVETGELFYYIYVIGRTKNKLGEYVDVLAFKDDKTIYFKKEDIDWEKVIDRNILSKAENIFEAMLWSTAPLKNERQGIFI